MLTILASQSFAGVGTTGIGLGNTNNSGDVLSVLGSSVFGTAGFGRFLAQLLILMVLSSAAASTQTTLVGLIAGIYMRFVSPGFFRKQTLTRATPTLVPDET